MKYLLQLQYRSFYLFYNLIIINCYHKIFILELFVDNIKSPQTIIIQSNQYIHYGYYNK